jgi:hypothetical protein
MSAHELVLLSPYRYPAQHAMTLADEDMASWLNGYTALWHPAVLWQAQGPPRCDAPYDHEQPRPGCIYALPESPPAYLPDDWDERVRAAGAVVFRVSPERATTLANLRVALTEAGAPAVGWPAGFELDPQRCGAFFGLGLGYLLHASLAEAMEHENLLDPAAFWSDVQFAISLLAGFAYTPVETGIAAGAVASVVPPEQQGYYEGPPELESHTEAPSPESGSNGTPPPPLPHDWREPLQGAATKLLSAREVLYPVTIHLLDLCVLDEQTLDKPWPAALDLEVPLNVIAPTALLERLAAEQPARFEALRQAISAGRAEVCGGSYLERADPLLPIDSQLWNLRQGLDRAKELLNSDVRVYARKRFGYHPNMPLFLSSNGVTRALLLTFDESSGLPHYTSPVISWPSPDGKQIEAFARAPRSADSPETFYNLGHYWFKTTREDHAATLVLSHGAKLDAPWYRDLMELARLAPVFGTWTTFSRYLGEVTPGEYPPLLSADEFHSDLLGERVEKHEADPVSSFARHLRTRRRLDACATYAALHRALSGTRDTLEVEAELRRLEDEIERAADVGTAPAGLVELERKTTAALADRLQARAAANQPGYLLLNPCGFARRVALELEGGTRPLPIAGPVKACQLDGSTLRVVAEVPALGFCWLPREGPPGTQAMPARLRLGDQATLTIRNEFLEAEVDSTTGGLRAIRDLRTRANRLGQQLVFNPGSRMVPREIKVTSGPALGEIVSTGTLVGEQDQVLAKYRQRLRLWLGRPLLEMRIELEPQQPPAGYPWHAYYGARFAWRDEREPLVRGVAGTGHVTQHPRPQTPDYLEIRQPPRNNTVIFPGGLPFHHKQAGRMVDVILITEGEKATTFELGLALDREVPMQTALGFASPLAIVPTTKGPPHIGASGWLFHIDASNLLLTRLVPGALEIRPGVDPPPNPRDAITARFLECAGYSGLAEFRCVRDPKRAVVLNAAGQYLLEPNLSGDIVHLEVSPNDLVQVQVEFS